MHTGKIILLTKLLTATDLQFYDFERGSPIDAFFVLFVVSDSSVPRVVKKWSTFSRIKHARFSPRSAL